MVAGPSCTLATIVGEWTVEITVFSPEQRLAVLDFARDYGLAWGRHPEIFYWKYERPLPASCPPDIPRLWTVTDGERVWGVFGTQPVVVAVRGELVSGAVAMDLHLHPRLRGQGFGRQLIQRLEAASSLRLMLFAAPGVHRLFLKNGYEELHGFQSMTGFVSLVRAGLRLGKAKLLRRRPPRVPLPIRARAPELCRHIPGCVLLEDLVPAEAESFLRRCQLEHELAVLRDVETLRWRYLEHPQGAAAVFGLRDDEGRLAAVFALAWKSMEGLDALVLADLYVPVGGEDRQREVMQALPRLAREVGADLYNLSTSAARLKREAGRFARRRHRACSVRLPTSFQGQSLDHSRWYLSAGEGDYIT